MYSMPSPPALKTPKFQLDNMSSTEDFQHDGHVCKYFLQNCCTRGAACLYKHVSNMKPPIDICLHYQQGKCRFGGQCHLLHVSESDNITATNPQTVPVTADRIGFAAVNKASEILYTPTIRQHAPKTDPTVVNCRFFKQGSCAKGASCLFLHTPSTTTPRLNPFASPFKVPRLSKITGSKPAFPAIQDHSQPVGVPCKYFGQGECTKGSACQFLHNSADSY